MEKLFEREETKKELVIMEWEYGSRLKVIYNDLDSFLKILEVRKYRCDFGLYIKTKDTDTVIEAFKGDEFTAKYHPEILKETINNIRKYYDSDNESYKLDFIYRLKMDDIAFSVIRSNHGNYNKNKLNCQSCSNCYNEKKIDSCLECKKKYIIYSNSNKKIYFEIEKYREAIDKYKELSKDYSEILVTLPDYCKFDKSIYKYKTDKILFAEIHEFLVKEGIRVICER